MLFEELDEQVREAARHYSKPCTESAWNKMSELIDRQQRKQRAWKYIPALTVLTGLLLSAFFLIHSVAKPEKENNQINKEQPIKTGSEDRLNNSQKMLPPEDPEWMSQPPVAGKQAAIR
jgi:hypothetical protein